MLHQCCSVTGYISVKIVIKGQDEHSELITFQCSLHEEEVKAFLYSMCIQKTNLFNLLNDLKTDTNNKRGHKLQLTDPVFQ